jgi:hypothetical protein
MTILCERVIALLEPKIGRSLAESVVSAKCEKLGIDPEQASAETLSAFADELYEPLKIFGGDDFARELVLRIKSIEP